ncbi:hypothetical protein QTP70_009479 [Hemibagrus guttatus]|uniref:Uncharacterized protein n=1 Tax=Hemibagrus guttatus TaxID=175788 RepID=A0AAE0PRA0_9TELE|nr:hypothetical protein QTP70_009479 [Hemibagrus guttatus]
MRPDCKESREPWHCTMMYDEEAQNEEYEAMWDEHVARTQYSLKTIDLIVGPQGAAAVVQLPKQLEQWYQIPEAAPHVSLLIGQGFESKELGPMVKEANPPELEVKPVKRTLALIQHDAAKENRDDFSVVIQKEETLTKEQTYQFYSLHQDEELPKNMTSPE